MVLLVSDGQYPSISMDKWSKKDFQEKLIQSSKLIQSAKQMTENPVPRHFPLHIRIHLAPRQPLLPKWRHLLGDCQHWYRLKLEDVVKTPDASAHILKRNSQLNKNQPSTTKEITTTNHDNKWPARVASCYVSFTTGAPCIMVPRALALVGAESLGYEECVDIHLVQQLVWIIMSCEVSRVKFLERLATQKLPQKTSKDHTFLQQKFWTANSVHRYMRQHWCPPCIRPLPPEAAGDPRAFASKPAAWQADWGVKDSPHISKFRTPMLLMILNASHHTQTLGDNTPGPHHLADNSSARGKRSAGLGQIETSHLPCISPVKFTYETRGVMGSYKLIFFHLTALKIH